MFASASPFTVTKIAETSFCMSGVDPPTPATLYFAVSAASSAPSNSGSPLKARQRFTASESGFSCPAMA